MSLLDDALRKAKENQKSKKWQPIIREKEKRKNKWFLLPLLFVFFLLGIFFYLIRGSERKEVQVTSFPEDTTGGVVIIVEEPPPEVSTVNKEVIAEETRKERTKEKVKKKRKTIKKITEKNQIKGDDKKRESRRLYRFALDMERRGELTYAVQSYERALKLDPDFYEARLNLSALNIELGQFDEAKKNLHILEEKKPEDRRVLYNLALLFYKTGDGEKASRYLKKILRKSPNDFEALLLLASIYESREEKDSALFLYERCLKIRRSPEVLLKAGRLCDIMGLRKRAISHYKEYLMEAPPGEIKEMVRRRLNYLRGS